MPKPSDFFIGVVEFFAVVLPGSALVFLLLPLLYASVPVDWKPLTEMQGWITFLVLSYISGHLLHALGSWLLDDYIYGKLYLPFQRPDHVRAALLRKDPKALKADEAAAATLLARVSLMPADATGTNYYDWCLSAIRIKAPAGAAEVDRIQADSKFFRSMVFVFLVAAIVSDRVAFSGVSLTAIGLTFFSLWRFCELRWTATKRVYEYYLLQHLQPVPAGDPYTAAR